jgi:hypothetical protein
MGLAARTVEKRNAYNVLAGNHKKKKLLGRKKGERT